MRNLNQLDFVSKTTQYLAIGFALLSVFVPQLGIVAAAFSAISFWASSKSEQLKDVIDRRYRNAHLIADEIAHREIDALRKQNEELEKSVREARSSHNKIEDFRRRIMGNLLTS